MRKHLKVTVEGKTYDVQIELLGDEAASGAPAPARSAAPAPAPATAATGEKVPSPLSGKVVSISVSVGQQVKEGDHLLTLEAMKMNTEVSSPAAGTISAIHVKPGDDVGEGDPLLSL